MSQTMITKEMVDWLAQFNTAPLRTDKKSDLIWKAAQRDLYERAKSIHEKQTIAALPKKQRKATELGFQLRPRED